MSLAKRKRRIRLLKNKKQTEHIGIIDKLVSEVKKLVNLEDEHVYIIDTNSNTEKDNENFPQIKKIQNDSKELKKTKKTFFKKIVNKKQSKDKI